MTVRASVANPGRVMVMLYWPGTARSRRVKEPMSPSVSETVSMLVVPSVAAIVAPPSGPVGLFTRPSMMPLPAFNWMSTPSSGWPGCEHDRLCLIGEPRFGHQQCVLRRRGDVREGERAVGVQRDGGDDRWNGAVGLTGDEQRDGDAGGVVDVDRTGDLHRDSADLDGHEHGRLAERHEIGVESADVGRVAVPDLVDARRR